VILMREGFHMKLVSITFMCFLCITIVAVAVGSNESNRMNGQ
jgi:hypothetical protein